MAIVSAVDCSAVVGRDVYCWYCFQYTIPNNKEFIRPKPLQPGYKVESGIQKLGRSIFHAIIYQVGSAHSDTGSFKGQITRRASIRRQIHHIGGF